MNSYKYPTFEIIKNYYDRGYYTVFQIKEYCRTGYITETEYYKLIGKHYWEDVD